MLLDFFWTALCGARNAQYSTLSCQQQTNFSHGIQALVHEDQGTGVV